MAVAPRRAAVSSAAYRSVFRFVFASTRRIRQLGQIALTMSRSSEISRLQSGSGGGSRSVLPVWPTFVKHPFAVVHGGRPYVDRYCARSDSAVGSSNASTIATVRPLPAVVDGRAYADCRSAGP